MTVRRTLNADERAMLEALLRDVAPRIYGYVRKAFGGAVDVDDVVAETFARAADNVESLRACDRRDLYLLTTARNLCRDLFRRKTPDAIPDAVLTQRCSNAADPAAEIDDDEDRRRLSAAIERLPDAQREVVVLRLSADLKFEEIAELLAIPLGTALSRMNAALRRLRKEFGCAHV